MAADDVFLIQVARPGVDGIGTPGDYATIRADVATALARVDITQLDDVPDVDAASPSDGDALLWDAGTSEWVAQPLPVPASLPISTGTGSPSGVVSAPVGSLYLRTDAAGGTQVWVKVSGTGSTGWLPIERASRRRTLREVLAYHTAALSSSYATVGLKDNPTLSATTYSNADSAGGAFLQLATSTTANNVASIVGGGGTNSAVWLDWRPDISLGIRVPNTITDIRLWYGVFASSPAASDDPAIAGFGFRFSTNASDTKFQAWSNDGTSGGTITDTGITVQANYAHDLRCIVNDAATAIDYYIDNAWVAQHTSNLPGASTPLTYGIYCTTLTTAARALRWGRITLESRP